MDPDRHETRGEKRPLIFTVGHSTRSAGELVALLEEAGVDLLLDVRRFPSSRRHPHFNRDALRETLGEAGIGYRHMEALGGRRGDPADDSPNTGWRTGGFQAYADHLNRSGEARKALREIFETAREGRSPAIMCAEIVPWRCHRQIIADHLVARDVRVRHLIEPGEEPEVHELREMAVVRNDGTVVYPADQGELFG